MVSYGSLVAGCGKVRVWRKLGVRIFDVGAVRSCLELLKAARTAQVQELETLVLRLVRCG